MAVIAVGDFIEITDVQTLLGQNVLNVYQYRVTALTGEDDTALDDIGSAWWSQNSPLILPLQIDHLEHTEVRVRNLTQPLYFGSWLTGVAGTGASGSTAGSYSSYGLVYNRATTAVKSGGKRIAGVPEQAVTDNNIVGSFLTNLQTLADEIDFVVDIDLGANHFTIRPVIIGRNSDGTYNLTRWSYVNGVSYNPYITTQNTRKQKRV